MVKQMYYDPIKIKFLLPYTDFKIDYMRKFYSTDKSHCCEHYNLSFRYETVHYDMSEVEYEGVDVYINRETNGIFWKASDFTDSYGHPQFPDDTEYRYNHVPAEIFNELTEQLDWYIENHEVYKLEEDVVDTDRYNNVMYDIDFDDEHATADMEKARAEYYGEPEPRKVSKSDKKQISLDSILAEVESISNGNDKGRSLDD